jgi:hypothetical protein
MISEGSAVCKDISVKPGERIRTLSKLFVFAAVFDSWFMLPSFTEHGLSPGDAVLLGIPTESVGHQSDLVVQTVDRILALIGSRGTPIQFLRTQIRESEPIESAINLLRLMKKQKSDETIVTLCDSLPAAGLAMYLAAMVYASYRGEDGKSSVHIYVPSRATGKRVELPVPIIPMPKDITLLTELERNPKVRLVDLQPKLKKHLSTISRQIATEKRNGFVAENDEGYFLTPLGKVVAEVLRPEDAKGATPKRGRPPKKP